MKNADFGFALDFDGTIVNSIDLVWKVQDAILERYDIQRTPELDRKIERKINEILAQENRKIGKPIMIAIFKLLGLNFFQRIRALLLARKLFKEESANISLFDGAREMFSLLEEKGIPYTIVTTSSNAEVADRLEEKYPEFYGKVRDRIIARDDVKMRKPHPESLQKAARKMNLPPENVVVVGDMKADIELGKSVGAITVGVLTGFLTEKQFQQLETDHVIDSIAKIPDVIDEIERQIQEKKAKEEK